MKKIMKGIELKHVSFWRIVAVGAIGVVVLAIVIGLVGITMRTAFRHEQSVGTYRYDSGMVNRNREKTFSVSAVPNTPPAPIDMQTVRMDEGPSVDTYAASIRTNKSDRLCDALASWREHDYITFLSVERNPHDCTFIFKTSHNDAPGIVRALQELNPVAFSSRMQSVPQAQYDTKEQELVLADQLASLRDTLADTDAQYKELMRAAGESGDADAIADAIQNRTEQVQRLSAQALDVSSQLAALAQQHAGTTSEEQDAFFTVYVRDRNIIDVSELCDMWAKHMQRFVVTVNDIIAGVTIGMLSFLLRIVEIGFYIGVILVVAKIGYQLVKKLWSHSA